MGLSLLHARLSAVRGVDGMRIAYLSAGSWRMRCALGRTGLSRRKREGDGATPYGRFRVCEWRFQPLAPPYRRPATGWRAIRRDDGWCDDPKSGAYNSQVRLPFRAGHENLWRADGKYAVVGILDYNLRPRKRTDGSAIFFHICDDHYGPTAGCIAITARDFYKLLPRLSRHVCVMVD